MKVFIDRADTTGVTFTPNGSGNTFSTVRTYSGTNGSIRVPMVLAADSQTSANGVPRRTMIKLTTKFPRFRAEPTMGQMVADPSGTEDESIHVVFTSGRSFGMLRQTIGETIPDQVMRDMVGILVSVLLGDTSAHAISIGNGTVPSTSFRALTRAMDEAWPVDGAVDHGSHV